MNHGGGGGWKSEPHKFVIVTRSRRGLVLAPSKGSGGMLPREILKIATRICIFHYLGYNFRKIRERICKVICTCIYNIYKIYEVTGKIRKIKKKIFNMKKIMLLTVDPATFFLEDYSRMSSRLFQNPIVCPCGHTGAAVHSTLRHRVSVI